MKRIFGDSNVAVSLHIYTILYMTEKEKTQHSDWKKTLKECNVKLMRI